MAMEDYENIELFDDLMNEVEKPKKQYRKIRLVIPDLGVLDELKY